MKSIIQEKDGTCFLCKILHADGSVKYVEEHHAIYWAKCRRLSEKYGLKVYLCPEHHRLGRDAVHRNRETKELVIKTAQVAFERRWGQAMFYDVFGRNWLTDGERERYLPAAAVKAAEHAQILNAEGLRNDRDHTRAAPSG